MPHTITHCGTAGEDRGERTIKIYVGSVLDYAARFSPHDMEAYGVPPKKIAAFEKWYKAHHQKLVKKIRSLGVPYHYHQPHPENFE